MSRTFSLVAGILLLASQGVLCSAENSSDPVAELFASPPRLAVPERSPVYPPIDFRGLLVSPTPSRFDPMLSDRPGWESVFALWKTEGYNNLVWLFSNELCGTGNHFLLRHEQFPEARELSPEQVEKNIADMNWLFSRAKQLGFGNYLYTHNISYTDAFAKAHKLTKYPHIRNDLTRKYTEAIYAEVCKLYPDLD
ncbi:MAG: hypothetical protein Q7T25_13060, partial [Sideroxyarcus sp.]|nr:hypothetical protein [Sideroxyarcus sp.]